MPIDILPRQQTLVKLGVIHIGCVVPAKGTDRNGKPKTMPKKLDKFRLTSPSKRVLTEVAALYGGTVQPWTPANGGPSGFEVFTETDLLPVLVRGNGGNEDEGSATSEWFEHYEGSRLKRKCTGSVEKLSNGKCLCDPNGILDWWDERLCKPTTRLSVMLRDLPAIGNWLIASKGRNTAQTLPPMARFLAQSDGYIPAFLGIEERISYPDEKTVHRFMVPVLHVELAPLELIAGNGAAAALNAHRTAAVGGAGLKEIGPGSDPGVEYYRAQADAAESVPELTRSLHAAQSHGHAAQGDELFQHYVARRKQLEEADVAVAEVVEDNEAKDRLWALCIENAPTDWDAQQLKLEFAKRNEGLSPFSASEQQLRDFLNSLTGGAR